MTSQTVEHVIHLPRPHAKQAAFIQSRAKRKVVRAGRRGGKTTGVASLAVEKFLQGKRILYAAPTQEQIDRFWVCVTRALNGPIDAGVFKKNETRHTIELPGSEQRIRAKTAWNADTLRGDYADELILDEFQMMAESAWNEVGAPMLADNDGNATFVYTPPSLRTVGASKATDPRHASKMYQRAAADTTGRWAAFHFTSYDNPHISHKALDELAGDMTAIAYRMEIKAEDIDEAPGALWTRESIELGRVMAAPELEYVAVAIDPSATRGGDEAGIVGGGRNGDRMYVLADKTKQGTPTEWATEAIMLFFSLRANVIVAESNNGGEMVSTVIAQTAINLQASGKIPHAAIPVKLVHASRGKATRAEPISAIYGNNAAGEPSRAHHVGSFPMLEDEMCLWIPGDPSPNRMDALVWLGTELSVTATGWGDGDGEGYGKVEVKSRWQQ